MKVEELHWALAEECNRFSYPELSDAQKDKWFNVAVYDYLDYFYHGTNPKGLKLGFESNQQRIDMCHTLVVDQTLTPSSNGNIYSFSLSSLIKPYYSYITSEVVTKTCGTFTDVRIAQHNDNDNRDYHRRSSKRFRKAVGLFKNNRIEFNTLGEFIITGLNLTYLKRPANICRGTYADLTDLAANPNTTTLRAKVECDLPEDYHNLLVTIAFQNIQRMQERYNGNVVTENKVVSVTN